MGLAWWMPDTETSHGFFKFLPRNYSENQQHLSETELIQLENILLTDPSTGGLANASELIRLRELQKDSILNDMVLCVNQSLNGNSQLRSPPTSDLIQEDVADIVERLFLVRKRLMERLEG
tara:strand:- start:363 stop:725 length:363 start_codon:yes stop_codon:yes gene_type:complete